MVKYRVAVANQIFLDDMLDHQLGVLIKVGERSPLFLILNFIFYL